jgi:cell division protein FtsB
MQQAFESILAQKLKIGGLEQQISQREQEISQLTNDQNRLRENMKALKAAPRRKH